MTSRQWLRYFTPAILVMLLAGAAITTPVLAASESAEIRGTVKTVEGEPLPNVEVVFTAIGVKTKPFTVKTRKDGTFVFPFLPWYKNVNYESEYTLAGYKVRTVNIESRQPQSTADRGQGVLIQSDESVLNPGMSPPPVVIRPGGKVTIDVGMVTDDFFEKMAQARAAADMAEARAEGDTQAASAAAALGPVEQARLLAIKGSLAEAEQVLTSSIEEEPTGEKWFELGRVRIQAEDTTGAKAALARAAGLDPEMRGVHFMLAKLYADEGRSTQAMGELEKELTLDPESTTIRRTLAGFYVQEGKKDEAVAIYEDLSAAGESDPEMLSRLAGLYAEKGDFHRSEEIYRRIAEQDPENADTIYLKIGLSIINQRDIGQDERKRAADAFRRSIEANPDNARAHLELGYVLLGLNELGSAKSELQKFVELRPGDKEAARVREMIKDL